MNKFRFVLCFSVLLMLILSINCYAANTEPQYISQNTDKKTATIKKVLKKKLKKLGYLNDDIDYIIYPINWDNVQEDLAPSFYQAIENKFSKKILRVLSEYAHDKKKSSKVFNIASKISSAGYGNSSIIFDINLDNVQDLAPSFYQAIENKINEDTIELISPYAHDEKISSIFLNLVMNLSNTGYEDYNTYVIIKNINWDKIQEDLAPSFYQIIEKKKNDEDFLKILSEQAHNETISSMILNLETKMNKAGYSDYDFYCVVSYIEWNKIQNNLAPSFLSAIENKLDRNSLIVLSKYAQDEKISSIALDLATKLNNAGYDEFFIHSVFTYIKWDEIQEDLAPSFYQIIEKKKNDKDILIKVLSQYAHDRKKSMITLNIATKMVNAGYGDHEIFYVTKKIKWNSVQENLNPFFYYAIEKKRDELDLAYWVNYVPNEKILTIARNLTTKINNAGYSDCDIILDIDWDNVEEDLAPSFYQAIENKTSCYILSCAAKYASNQKKFRIAMKVSSKMSDMGYDYYHIISVIYPIKWDNIEEDLAPSFYQAIENKINEILLEKLSEYAHDENASSIALKFAIKLLNAGYNPIEIIDIFEAIKFDTVKNDFELNKRLQHLKDNT